MIRFGKSLSVVAACLGVLSACESTGEFGGPVSLGAADDGLGSRVPTVPVVPPVPTTAVAPPQAGLAYQSGDIVTFRVCGTKEARLVEDQTGGDLAAAMSELSGDDGLFVEVRATDVTPDSGILGNVLLGAPEVGKRQPIAITEIVRAAPAIETHGCKQAVEPIMAWASGNEPFWALTVKPEAVTFIDVGIQARSEFSYRPAKGTPAGFTFRAGTLADGRIMTATFVAERCIDTMSGAWSAYRVTAMIGGKEFEGCGRTGRLFELATSADAAAGN